MLNTGFGDMLGLGRYPHSFLPQKVGAQPQRRPRGDGE